MPEESVRSSYVRRLHRCERELRELVGDILADLLPGGHGRDRRKTINDRITILMASVEDVIYLDPEAIAVSPRDRRIRDMHEKMDEVLAGKAELDRARREIYREMEDLDLEGQRLQTRQIAAEFDAELER